MKISQNGINLIKQLEGVKLGAYLDSKGIYTIGVGCTTYQDKTKVKKGDKITQAQCDELLSYHLKHVEDWLNTYAKWCNQNQFDALCSFLHQYGTNLIGRGYLNTDTAIKTGNLGAIRRFLLNDFNHVDIKKKDGLLKKRREKELDLFNKDVV